MNKILLLMGLLVLAVGCGQKSIIKNQVESQTLAEAYGDGEYVVRPLILPLSDQAISTFDSPVEKIDFIAGGFARMFMNLGANMGLGRGHLTLVQPIPEIPTDIIKSAKIKRLFFMIEPKKGRERWSNFFRRFFRGQGDINFNFLENMAIKMSSVKEESFESWYPVFDYKSLKKREYTPLQRLFEEDGELFSRQDLDEDSAILMKYDQANRDRYLKNKNYGFIYVLYTKEPAQTKRYLMKHPRLQGFFKQIHMLNESLVVELEKDPVAEEGFKLVLSEDAELMEKFKIDMIEECTEETCLDLEVLDANLLPLIKNGNAIKIDAYMNAKKVPDSFQLKGFIEFEIKLKLSF